MKLGLPVCSIQSEVLSRLKAQFCMYRGHSFIHSFRSVSCERSIASSKVSSPQRIIQCFLFQFLAAFLSSRSTNSCLHLLQCLSITSLSHSIVPSIMCFRRLFRRKMWPTLSAFLRFIVYMEVKVKFINPDEDAFPVLSCPQLFSQGQVSGRWLNSRFCPGTDFWRLWLIYIVIGN